MRKQLCVLSLLAFSFAGYAQGQVTNNISSFNSIDDLLNTDFVEPESRDVFNGEGGADTNGVADVSVSETTTGVTRWRCHGKRFRLPSESNVSN